MAVRRLDREEKLIGWWLQAVDVWSGWRQEASIDRAYYENRQWTASEAAELEKYGQPVITVNHIYPKVNLLVGLLLQQKPTIRCLPRGKDDAEVASIATKVIRYVFDVNNLQAKLAEAFTDMATTGAGWLECRVSSVVGQDPIVIEYVPWDEIIFDPLSRQPDLSDARFIFRGRWVDEDIFVEFFPEAKEVLQEVRAAGGITNLMPGMEQEWYDQRRKRVFVLECQYKVFEERECFWDGVELTPYNPDVHGESLAEGLGRLLKARVPVIRQAIMMGDWLIRDNPLPYIHGQFTFVPFMAQRTVDGSPIGVVRYLRDMQDEINKRRSKVLHYLSAKRVIAEEGAIPDPDEFREELMRPDAFLVYRKGYQVQIEQDLQLGAQHFELMKEATNEMSLISGIFPDFLGMPTNARTAAAIRQRVLQAQTSVQKYFSAVERGLKRLAELTLALARQYYTGPRVIQLTDEPYAIVLNEPVQRPDGTVEVRNSLAKLRADIVVQVQQGGMTERQQELIQLVELMKALPPELTALSLDVLIDAFDIPQKGELKNRFRQLIALQLQQQAQQGQGQELKGQTNNNTGGGGQ